MKRNLLKFALCAMAMLPMGAWADDAVPTIWEFSGQTTGSITSVTNLSGLYIKASATQTCSYTTLKRSGKFSDNSDWSTTTSNESGVALQINSNSNLTPTNSNFGTIDADATNRTGRSVVFETSYPGKIYVAIYIGSATSGTVGLYKVAAEETLCASLNVATGLDKNKVGTIEYESTTAGKFVIGSKDANTTICYIKFVPTLKVSIGATGYATFGNNEDFAYSLPEGLTAYAANVTSSSVVTLTKVDQMRKLNGYVLKGTPSTDYYITPTTDNGKAADKGGEMMRVKTAKSFDDTSEQKVEDEKYLYILGNDGGTAKFFIPQGGTLAVGKAYLATATELIPPSSARGISIVFADDITSVKEVKTQNEKVDNKYYDMMGRRVANPTKGLYIVNGKKVIIK